MDCSLGFLDLLFRVRPQHLRPCLLWLFYQLIYVAVSTLKQTIITILAARESLNEFVDEFQFIYFLVRTRARICKDWPYNIDSRYNRLGWAENFGVNCFDSWLKAIWFWKCDTVYLEFSLKSKESLLVLDILNPQPAVKCEALFNFFQKSFFSKVISKDSSFKSHATSPWTNQPPVTPWLALKRIIKYESWTYLTTF